uniref:Avidin 1 n=1 Tax=Branchiostoma japonicum TaxID=373177 RepID=A0A1W5XGF5_9BRAN|nr:avidin 1 [Branchiostoma japonicum]
MFRAVSGVILRPSFNRMMRSAVSSKGTQRHCCGITGTWWNQHDSCVDMEIQDDNGQGVLTGCYKTAVGSDPSHVGEKAPMVGFPPKKDGGTFGWVVNWKPSEDGDLSTTTWTAQCVTVKGKPVLQTTWILRSEVEKAADRWESTLVAQDTFTRERPPKQDD